MKKINKRFISVALLSVALVAVCGIGYTFALNQAKTKEVVNSFDAGILDTEIIEEIDGLTKKIQIKGAEDSTAASYVRVRINATPSNVFESEDISSKDGSWVKGNDGFWYYTEVVTKNKSTSVLEAKYTINEDEYNKVEDKDTVDVIVYSESIQADIPECNSYIDAWAKFGVNVVVDNN